MPTKQPRETVFRTRITSHPPQDAVASKFVAALASGSLLDSASYLQQAHATRQELDKAAHAKQVFCLEVEGVRATTAAVLTAVAQRTGRPLTDVYRDRSKEPNASLRFRVVNLDERMLESLAQGLTWSKLVQRAFDAAP